MIERLCSRCHSVLQLENDGVLVFCWNCGAPRVLLSEELRSHAEEQSKASADAGPTEATRPSPPADPTAVTWKTMIQISALVAAAFVLVSVMFAAFPATSIFLPPLALVVPAVVINLYTARNRYTTFSTTLGMRVGLICGLFTSLGISTLSVGAMLLSRFVTHQMGDFDQSLTTAFLHAKAQVVAQQGQAATSFFAPFSIPEFRAGMMIAVYSVLIGLIVLLSAAGGALAGFVRSRVRAR